MLDLTEQDFLLLHQYIRAHYGLDLRNKKQLIVSRLSGMLTLQGYADFHSYVARILSGKDQELLQSMLNRLTTNYTFFMREPSHFHFLETRVLPEMVQKHRLDRTINIWSAGCSSGEEPYCIAMYLLEFLRRQPGRWRIRLLATDLSEKILQAAADPVYRGDALDSLPVGWRERYFLPRPDGGWAPGEKLKSLVEFRRFNLMEPIPFQRSFDIIFCRNVMIYFDQKTKQELVNRFYQVTAPAGYFFVGHSEGLIGFPCPYDCVEPSVYRKQDPVPSSAVRNSL